VAKTRRHNCARKGEKLLTPWRFDYYNTAFFGKVVRVQNILESHQDWVVKTEMTGSHFILTLSRVKLSSGNEFNNWHAGQY
jgi:hypothetical protein